MIIGYVAWYSMSSKQMTPLSQLKKFRELDPLIKIPKGTNKENIFRKLCDSYGDNICFLAITKDDKHLLEYEMQYEGSKLADISFHKKVQEIYLSKSLIPLSVWETSTTNQIYNDIVSKLDTTTEIDNLGVRSVIRSYLEDTLGALKLRNGTYFLPVSRKKELSKLEHLCVDTVECEFVYFPVHSDNKTVTLIEANAQREIDALVNRLKDKINKIAAKKPVAVSKVLKIEEEAKPIKQLQELMDKLSISYEEDYYKNVLKFLHERVQ